MASYYVNRNAQTNGDHEVHVANCSWFPAPENIVYLGEFTHCQPAVEKAKEYYAQVNGCAYCCPFCNTG